MTERRIPVATVSRLPEYLEALTEKLQQGEHTTSSQDLALSTGVNAAKVRKDLSYMGQYGTRGVGYDIPYLIHHIERVLGLTEQWRCALVGVGNLGRALVTYPGFEERGFQVVAAFDTDPAVIGTRIGPILVQPASDLEKIVAERGVVIGIVAVPAPAAQDAVDALVDAGVKSILSFAPVTLYVPEDVTVRKVDLSMELQILSFHEQRKHALLEHSDAAPLRRVN
ncbi:MAG TPA: redox-sensing transcriptional repressor Rex [Gaiellaceae bacterium]|nr:redox-sensing transcriptional repressor Rex [Gaiellaceae bacterium]